jgi:hypothetical protein
VLVRYAASPREATVATNFEEVRHVIDTNVTGSVHLVQLVTRTMRSRGQGRILLTGSVAGFIPCTYQAVYNARRRRRCQRLEEQAAVGDCVRHARPCSGRTTSAHGRTGIDDEAAGIRTRRAMTRSASDVNGFRRPVLVPATGPALLIHVINDLAFKSLLCMTVVVSPLIALRPDQFHQLSALGLEACFDGSSEPRDTYCFIDSLITVTIREALPPVRGDGMFVAKQNA